MLQANRAKSGWAIGVIEIEDWLARGNGYLEGYHILGRSLGLP